MDPRDATQETDVWWGAFAGRTMMPSFFLCWLLSAVVGLLAWSTVAGGWLSASRARYLAEALIGLLWLGQLGRWGYWVLALNYRLTTRRLYLERGFHTPANRRVELADIAQIVVQRNASERFVGVGRIRVRLADGSEPFILYGVRNPDHVAVLIRAHVEKAREAGEGVSR